MINDPTMKLITELASWNGRLSAVIEMALIDLQHNNPQGAVQALATIDAEYEAYREAQCAVKPRPVLTEVRDKDLDYDLKHGE